MKIKVKKLHPDAIIPKYATPGAACFDLTSTGEWEHHKSDFQARVFGTGLSFEIPEGYVMLVFSRSGHGFNYAVRLSNCVGVIDSDYRGELKVSMRADCTLREENDIGKRGTRIAQAMIVPLPTVELEEVPNLNETLRGAGGFGSTGA